MSVHVVAGGMGLGITPVKLYIGMDSFVQLFVIGDQVELNDSYHACVHSHILKHTYT